MAVGIDPIEDECFDRAWEQWSEEGEGQAQYGQRVVDGDVDGTSFGAHDFEPITYEEWLNTSQAEGDFVYWWEALS